jgi:hypothetical protein
MTVKEHLKSVHTKLAEHHVAAAKFHKSLAKCFGMEKAQAMESSSDIADAHEGLAQQHIDLAEYHLTCCQDLSKAAGFDDLAKADGMMPDFVSALAPEVPSSVRMVLRSGQRDFSKVTDGMDTDLSKVIGLDETLQ